MACRLCHTVAAPGALRSKSSASGEIVLCHEQCFRCARCGRAAPSLALANDSNASVCGRLRLVCDICAPAPCAELQQQQQQPPRVVVIELGSALTRCGFAHAPPRLFPTVVGRARPSKQAPGGDMGQKMAYVGDEAFCGKGRNFLLRSTPVHGGGRISSWPDVAEIVAYALHSELRVDPARTDVVVVEPAGCADDDTRAQFRRIVVDKLGCPSVAFASAPVVQLHVAGRACGIVVDIGAEQTTISPVCRGAVVCDAVRRLAVGGHTITTELGRLLADRGYAFSSPSDRAIVDDVKKRLCFVVLDAAAEAHVRAPAVGESYELPDGQVIDVGAERFLAPEVLFRSASGSLAETVYAALLACPPEWRPEIAAEAVVLAGGSSALVGLAERLRHELRSPALWLPWAMTDAALWFGKPGLVPKDVRQLVCSFVVGREFRYETPPSTHALVGLSGTVVEHPHRTHLAWHGAANVARTRNGSGCLERAADAAPH